MIAVDSNVLLRKVLDDDVKQAAKARLLFESHAAVLITDVVLAETVWTLAGKRFRMRYSEIGAMLSSLIDEKNVVFEDEGVVWAALDDYLEGRGEPGFVDALILHKSKATAAHRFDEFQGMYTFDADALKLFGTEAL